MSVVRRFLQGVRFNVGMLVWNSKRLSRSRDGSLIEWKDAAVGNAGGDLFSGDNEIDALGTS